MDSSKRQTTPWTKNRKKPGPKKKEKGEHFDESKKKELAASDKRSWFDQPSSDISAVSRVSHPSTSREEVGASTLKLKASKASTSGLAESHSTSDDESNGSTESVACVAWWFKQFERAKTSGEAARRSLGEKQLRFAARFNALKY